MLAASATRLPRKFRNSNLNMIRLSQTFLVLLLATFTSATPGNANAQVLDKQQQLDRESWWYDKDFEWYKRSIPFFECPDREITTTYYYRWDLLKKHLTYGSPNTGYVFTEFIDRPFWSGAYGAISCPAGHQLYETRWLRGPRVANDYSRYWFRTPGAQPRNYSTWLADSIWAVHQVHPDKAFLVDLLDDLIKNYQGWEARQFVPDVGLFWQTGHDDGMEFNILSRQTKDILRGAPSYRPSFNAYMWADAQAIARIAKLADRAEVAEQFTKKADSLKANMLKWMWDEKRQFFFPVLKNDEELDGHKMKALTRTYESGKHAGDAHGRELIGYVPWQFNMLGGPSARDVAWKKLMDRDGFYAEYGPSFVERSDPMFLVTNHCCWWSGQSWPYATTQTLKALANSIQGGSNVLSTSDYTKMLGIFAQSHRKNGKPYLAEALNPDTGSFEGYDGYNHSEHYLHSGYCDLIITGLAGLIPRDDDTLQVHPLAPMGWEYFALDDIPYRGHLVSIVWDKKGDRYQFGKGLHLIVDGKRVGGADALQPVVVEGAVPIKSTGNLSAADSKAIVATNFVVNNDGTFFPKVTASFTANNTSPTKLNDGNYWYLRHPPNRWTCEGSPNEKDSVVIDFGVKRTIHTVTLYPLDDSGERDSAVRTPLRIELEAMIDNAWHAIKPHTDILNNPQSHRANVVEFDPIEVSKLRITLHHRQDGKSGLSEIEAWGDVRLPLESAPPPAGNLAYNPKPEGFPRASSSFSDRFGGKPNNAIDGKTVFTPTPMNRWTSYESKSKTDWLEIDFGREVEFRRVELAIYDDHGGVQPPASYTVEHWTGAEWREVVGTQKSPEKPVGSQWNEVRFDPLKSSKVRIVFTHRGEARSGSFRKC